MKRTQRLAGVVFWMALWGAAARADIAPDPLGGGVNPRPRAEPTDVAMASEEVAIVLSPGKAAVTATFHMENAGTETALEVGFPLNYKDEMTDFSAEVDGKGVPSELKEQVLDRPYGGTYSVFWRTWPMTFGAGAKHTVVVRYAAVPRKSMFRIRDSWTSTWDERFADPEDLERLAPHRSGYILQTGAPWRGPIGKAVVTLTLGGGLTREHLRTCRPPPVRAADGTLSWTFESFEPVRDIEIDFNPALTLASEIDLLRAASRPCGDADDDLAFLLGLLDAQTLASDASGLLETSARIAEFVRTRQIGQEDDEWESPGAFLEAAVHLLEDPEARRDPAALRSRAEELLKTVEAWVPHLSSQPGYRIREAIDSLRAVEVRCRRILGQDPLPLLRSRPVSTARWESFDLAPGSFGMAMLVEESVTLVSRDGQDRCEVLCTLRGLKDGVAEAILWEPLEPVEAWLVREAGGVLDSLQVSIDGATTPVGTVRVPVEDVDYPDGAEERVGWSLPVRAGKTSEVRIVMTRPSREPHSGWVWEAEEEGPPTHAGFRLHRQGWSATGRAWTVARAVRVSVQLPAGITADRIRDSGPSGGAVAEGAFVWSVAKVGTNESLEFAVTWRGFSLDEEAAWLRALLTPPPSCLRLVQFQLSRTLHAQGKYDDACKLLEEILASGEAWGPASQDGNFLESPGCYTERPLEAYILDARRKLPDADATLAAARRAVGALRARAQDPTSSGFAQLPLWLDILACEKLIGDAGAIREAEEKVREMERTWR